MPTNLTWDFKGHQCLTKHNHNQILKISGRRYAFHSKKYRSHTLQAVKQPDLRSEKEFNGSVQRTPQNGKMASSEHLSNGHGIDQGLEERRQSSNFASTSEVRTEVEISKAAALIASGNPNLSLDEIASTFKFTLDDFQKEAVQDFLNGSSVLVCAPTGAGKTAIAEAATIATLAKGLRVIYTTPLKALSNQKLLEMRVQFGSDRVGLQTGDVSLNAEADVVIMTTEVLRNILYRPGVLREDSEEGISPESSDDNRMANVGLVVLDEVHYLGSPDRGSVWEEVIISCHKDIAFLCMSATVSNPEDLGGWITKVHGPCKTVVTEFRPVPLYWNFCHSQEGKTRIGPLMDESWQLHPSLHTKIEESDTDDDVEAFLSRRSRSRRSRGESRKPQSLGRSVPSIDDALTELKNRNLLPAIWFTFSRAGCDTSALQLKAQRVNLVSKEESERIKQAIDELRQDQPEAIRDALVIPLQKGIASHHAGCLPAWKSLVENLYRQGLIKVVFATGTLAAGINMPARSTIVSTTSRRHATGYVNVTHNELLQMAGRAGRRGFDTEGHCVLLQDPYAHASSIVDILRAGPEPLQSHFSTGYGMVLKILNTRSLEYAQSFVKRSFYNYLAEEGVTNRQKTINELRQQAVELLKQADSIALEQSGPDDSFPLYLTAKNAYQEKKKEHRKVFNAMLRQRAISAVSALSQKGLPAVIGVEFDAYEKRGELTAALVVADERSNFRLEMGTSFLCLTADNRLLQIAATNIAAVGSLQQTISHAATLPVLGAANASMRWKQLKTSLYQAQGTGKTARLATKLLGVRFEKLEVPPSLMRDLTLAENELKTLKKDAERLQREASKKQTDREDLKLRAEATKLKRRARAMEESMKKNTKQDTSTWRAFENTLLVLVQSGALEQSNLSATSLGSVARELNADNELWLAVVLTNEALIGIEASSLVGVLCAFVAGENNLRSNFSVKYDCSNDVLNVIDKLEPNRENLYYLQNRYGVDANLDVDLRLSGIAEAWASGASWEQIMSDCSMEAGDIARLLSRTLDILRQVMFCSALPSTLRDTAREASKGMARKPITDMIV